MVTPAPEISIKTFERDGYVVFRRLSAPDECARLASLARKALSPLVGPAEFEADVGYPGSPADRSAEGGQTPRRLLNVYARGAEFRRWATHERVAATLLTLMGRDDICLSQCHHNCIMTKHPGYSSATLWHQDIRYWSFDRPDLVSVWFALGPETVENGALRVIPGTHRLDLDRGRLDRGLFLRPDLAENASLIASAVPLELEIGDVVFFHSRLFHAAGRNDSNDVKLSLVFTYHDADNHPIPGTRSAQYPSIEL